MALAANLVIAVAKAAGGLIAGSPALLSEAAADVALDDAWCARAEAARDAVVRRSLELRAVVTRLAPT